MCETRKLPARCKGTVLNLIPLLIRVAVVVVVVIALSHVPKTGKCLISFLHPLLPVQMGNAGMGVHIFPLLSKLLVKGSIHPCRVHVVPGRDNEVASVPETKVSHGVCNLVLMVMSIAPVPDGNEMEFIVTVQLHLDISQDIW